MALRAWLLRRATEFSADLSVRVLRPDRSQFFFGETEMSTRAAKVDAVIRKQAGQVAVHVTPPDGIDLQFIYTATLSIYWNPAEALLEDRRSAVESSEASADRQVGDVGENERRGAVPGPVGGSAGNSGTSALNCKPWRCIMNRQNDEIREGFILRPGRLRKVTQCELAAATHLIGGFSIGHTQDGLATGTVVGFRGNTSDLA